jgi:hypothetical protein
MKFTKLIDKFEKLFDTQTQGRPIKPGELQKLQQLLTDKKSRYKEKLEATQEPEKRKKLETKLKVVNAQLEKSKHLASG